MEPNAPSYLMRDADAQLLKTLLRGEYVYLLDSRQKGKSSLVARTIVKLKEQGILTVKLDLQRIGANVTPEQWYAGLMVGIGQELGIAVELIEYWESRQSVGPLARWLGAISDVVLAKTDGRIVIFIDEVDFVRALDFSTDEFFAGIRDCYNRRSEQNGFERLTFCLVGVATPGQLIRNPEITPFNIGTKIELTDFTLDETKGYYQALGPNGEALLKRVHHWVNGHPYLTQLLCSHIAEKPAIASPHDVDRLVRELFFTPEARHTEPNFAAVEQRILDPDVPGLSPDERKTQVLELYGRLLRGKGVEASEENPVVASLQLAGVGHQVHGSLHVRNLVYKTVFDEGWRRQSLPNAELRRQRGAAKIAILRTATVAGIVVLVVSSLAFGMWRLSSEREKALIALKKSTSDLSQVSDSRKLALNELQTRNQELKQTSNERQIALSNLEKSNEVLKKTASERQLALANLQIRSKQLILASTERELARVDARTRKEELSKQSYAEQMAHINSAISSSQWMKISAAIEKTRTNPNRGWEWGTLALATHQNERHEQLAKWSVLEPQASGTVYVSTPSSLLDISRNASKVVREFPNRSSIIPRFVRGRFRVQTIESTRGDAICDEVTGQMLVRNKTYSQIRDIDTERRLYLLSRDETLETVELRTIDGDKLLYAYKGPNHAHGARFLPDGTILSIHQTDTDKVGVLHHWDISGKTLDTALSEQQYAHDIILSSDGTMYIAWGFDEKAEVRTVKGHERVSSIVGNTSPIVDIAISNDNSMILIGCADGIVRVFDLKSGKLLRTLIGHKYPIYSVAIKGDGSGYFSIDTEGYLRVWDSKSRPPLETFTDHVSTIKDACILSDIQRLLSVTYDGKVVSRDLKSQRIIRKESASTKDVTVVAPLDYQAHAVYVGRSDGVVEGLLGSDLSSHQSSKIFDSPVNVLRVVAGGRRVFVGSTERKFAILDASTLRVVARIEPRITRKSIDSTGVEIKDTFAFDREKPQFSMFLGGVGEIQVYSSLDGSLIKKWNPGRTVFQMVFIANGRQMVASLAAEFYVRDGKTIVYDPKDGSVRAELASNGRAFTWFEYSPKSNVLASRVGSENIGFLWDANTFQKIAELSPEQAFSQFSFSPDGLRVISNSWTSIRQWNSRTGGEFFRITGSRTGMTKDGWPMQPRFSTDGRDIVLPSPDGWVKVWHSLPWKDQPKAARK